MVLEEREKETDKVITRLKRIIKKGLPTENILLNLGVLFHLQYLYQAFTHDVLDQTGILDKDNDRN